MARDGVSYNMEGLPELLGKLDTVSSDIKYKGGRFALRRAAQAIRNNARENAARVDDPATPEDIAKNIVERWNGRLFKRKGDLGFRIGVLGGARNYESYGEFTTGKKASMNPGGDTYYWRFLEFGTSHMAAQPFMRPAADKAGQEAVNVFITQYGKAVERAIKRARKKGVK